MKVLQINARCGTGCTGRIVTDLCSALKQQGEEYRAVFGLGEARGIPKEAAYKMNNAAGYYFHNALSRLTDHTGLYSAPQTLHVIEKIREYDPDLIHLHNLHGYYLHYGHLFRYLAEAGKPVVWTLHDCWPFTGHCAYFTNAQCQQWKAGCVSCPQLRSYPKCYTRGDVANNYRAKRELFSKVPKMHLVAPSQWLADLAGESFLGKNPIHVIPNGIDADCFQPGESGFRNQFGLEAKKIVLGVANVWDARKGLQDCVALSRRLPEDHRLVLVGVSRKQLKQLPRHILGLPRTQNTDQLAQIYRAADVLINPTYEDNFPTVNLEAQACGTPVITYQVGGSPETVLPGCGAAVPKGDVNALCRKAIAWCSRKKKIPVDIPRLSRATSCEQYLALYRQILDGHKGATR